ncbi:hypothetical protein ECANGB1_2793 [Enterospora canceri]|uniref:Amino acid transporter transmembrane domain-containing protein n=1 Tax=Enterospora canceri TaxID=1081671 RepID=A0A1Y1S7G0_9MICR|nr:hypothetical protein ECANGB1_2793 [Enterospora canceri]
MKSLASAYVNLLKTSIGSGVLNFPYLFKTYGMATAVALALVAGACASTGLYLLMLCSQEVGRGADLGLLAAHSIPYARTLVDVAVFVKCFGVATSYVVIVGGLLPKLLATFYDSPLLAYPPFCLGCYVLLISPICYTRRLDTLKYTSAVGVVAVAFVVAASVYRYSHELPAVDASFSYGHTPPSVYWLAGLGKFVFSFTCHQNIFYVYAEMEDNSLRRMRRLITVTALSAFFLYMAFGASNYLIYGSTVRDNVLMNYPEDLLASIVHVLYVVVMGVSYPLQLAPGKTYFMNLVGHFGGEKRKNSAAIGNVVTTVMILGTYAIAVSGVGLGFLYAIVGATASTFMSLILPAIYYLHADIEKTLLLTLMSYASFLIGIFVFLTTIISLSLRIPVH